MVFAPTERLFLDWIPYATPPICTTTYPARTIPATQFGSFFKNAGEKDFVAIATDYVVHVVFAFRNDGFLLFNISFLEDLPRREVSAIARSVSSALKEKLHHIHAFHGSGTEFQCKGPVEIDQNELSTKGSSLTNFCEPKSEVLKSVTNVVNKIGKLAAEANSNDSTGTEELINLLFSSDTLLSAIPMKPNNHKTIVRLAPLKLREDFSQILWEFFKTKDAIRNNTEVAHITSFAVLTLWIGLLSPWWAYLSELSGNAVNYSISLLVMQVIALMIVVFSVFKAQKPFEMYVRNRKKNLLKRSVDWLFRSGVGLRRIVVPSVISITMVLMITLAPFQGEIFSLLGLKTVPTFTFEEYFTLLADKDYLSQILVVWVAGTVMCHWLEIRFKRRKIRAKAISAIGYLQFGDIFTKVLSNVIGNSDLSISRYPIRQYDFGDAKSIIQHVLEIETQKVSFRKKLFCGIYFLLFTALVAVQMDLVKLN